MGPAKLLRILLGRWKVALATFVLAAVVGGAVVWLLPRSYTATAVVLVDGRVDPVLGGAATMVTPAQLSTQADVVRSARVSSRVIRTLKLDQNAQLREQFAEAKTTGSYLEWLSNLLERNLVVEPGRGSNVLQISYTAIDPQFSALMANAFMSAYLDTVVEMRVEPAKRYSEFFDDRSKRLRETLEAAQEKLSAQQRQTGILASDERYDIETARLNELSSQLTAMQATAIESGSRQTQALAAGDRSQEVLSSGLIAGLKGDLARQEAKLQELRSRLGESHPQVVETKASIQELRTKVESETQRVTGSVKVNNAVNRQREAELRAALEAQRARVLGMRRARDELAVLQRDVEIAQRAYESVQQRFIQASMESQNQQTNISVLNPAEVPNTSELALLLKNGAKALAVALALGLAAALAAEQFDARVRLPADVATLVDLPVIGTMYGPDPKRLFGRERSSLLQRRLVRSLPAPRRG